MALLEDTLGGWAGIAVGVVVGMIAAPKVAGTTGSALRPVAKAVIRGALALSDTMKEVIAEAREQTSDLVAEVQAERAQTNGGAARGETH